MANHSDDVVDDRGNGRPVRENGGGGGGGDADAASAAAALLAPALPPRKHVGRKSLLPQIELSEYNTWTKADASPQGSLRKKFVFTMPGVMKQEQPREYKLKAFVVCLFFLIVIYISLTYVYHKQQELRLIQIEIAERIHFGEAARVLKVFNRAKQEISRGELGIDLPSGTPYDCLHSNSSENKCLEWKHTARLRVTRLPLADSNNRCFNISWASLLDTFEPCDCFSLLGHWYGMAETIEHKWPLEKNQIPLTPLVTGDLFDYPFGNAIERYWLSSKGIAILVHPSVPLFISMNNNNDGKLCLRAKHEDPFAVPKQHLPVLNYTLCTGSDMKTLHDFMTSHFHYAPESTRNIETMIERVIWYAHNVSDNDTLISELLVETEIESPFTDAGVIVFHDGWKIVEDHDDQFNEILTRLRSKGFKLVLAIPPYISTSSKHYLTGIDERRWVLDTKKLVPGLTKWEWLQSAAIIDFSNNDSIKWFHEELVTTMSDYKIDGFSFLSGESFHLPYKYTVLNPVVNPDQLTRNYAKMAFDSNMTFSISTMSDNIVQPIQTFFNLAPRTSTWDSKRGLKSIIRSVLNLGIMGYPFVNIGSIGGDKLEERSELIEKELFRRWLQLSVFFPVLQFSVHPKEYGNDVLNEASFLLEFRKTKLVPLLKKLAIEAAQTRSPIIRPLWWTAPNDSVAAAIDTQFLVGNDIMVAPVLDPGIEYQDIYFPKGMWEDALSPKIVYTGSRWKYKLASNKNQALYFIRLNDTENWKN